MEGGGDEAIEGRDETGAGDVSSMARRPAAPNPTSLGQKRYKKLGTAHCKMQIVCQLNR
jgi:hypothetical protein